MDDSIIDLCDSDDDDVNSHKSKVFTTERLIATKSAVAKANALLYNNNSSSASSDEELWTASGFPTNRPQQQAATMAVRKGNYFREAKQMCSPVGAAASQLQKAASCAANKEQVGRDKHVTGDEDEGFDEDVRNSHRKKSHIGESQPNEFVGGMSSTAVQCIEIDLSSSPSSSSCHDDSHGGNYNEKCKKKNAGNGTSSPSAEFQIRRRSLTAAAAGGTVAVASKPPPKKTKGDNYNINNDSFSNRNDDDTNQDDDSSTTIPLPGFESDLINHNNNNNKQEEIDLSMDCSDDDDDPAFVNNDNRNDNDDSSRDNGDKKPKHKKKDAVVMIPTAATATVNKSLRDSLIDIYSDDSPSSSSNDSIDLFTPRPTEKKEQQKKTSFTIDTSMNATKMKDANNDKNKTVNCPDSTRSTSSKLLTPREFSPSSTSPFGQTFITNTIVSQRVPTPAIPAMSATLVKEIGGRLYPDLTHNFIIALTSQARRARHNTYQRASFDSALRSIVIIALHMKPLRTAEATRRMKGVGSNFYDLLKESVGGSKGKSPFIPRKGKYTCVAPAALVGLLELEEMRAQRERDAITTAADGNVISSNNGNDDDDECDNSTTSSSFPMEDLILSINSLLDSRANANLSQSAQQYLNKDNLDPGWGQVKKLCSTNATADLGGPFIKERKRKGACASGRVFELLESGRSLATKLREFALSGPFEPGPLRQLPDETVDREFGNVTMSMDFREGGGGGRSLHKMCDQLDIRGVPYVVRELKIADYIFFVGEKLAPVLIERKTADDVAGSLHDGRWERQQRTMRKAQYVLGGGTARRCQICYIIEGDASKRTVHGGNVGRRTWFQSVDDVENAIGKLPSLGFSVMRSKSILDTIGILAKVVQDVSWKAKNGNIDIMYTYEQFLSRVKKLGEDKGEPPTDRSHMNPAPPVVVNTNFLSNAAVNAAAAAAAASPTGEGDETTFSPEPTKCGFDSDTETQQQNNNAEQVTELKKLSMEQLKEMLKDRDEKIGGKKEELISRLLKPRKPELLIMRARRKEYVPRVPSSNAALMVALLLHHIPGTQGLTKERLMVLAEETGISKESMSGDGSNFYDGWSGIKQLQEGDPALIRKEKGHRYSLTTQPPDSAGIAVANALHIVAHRDGLCTCGNPPVGV